MENLNFPELFQKYRGLWVALTESLDTVIAADKHAKTAYDEAVKKGYSKPTMFKVPKENNAYIGIVSS